MTAEDLHLLVGERTVPHLWHENYWFRRHEFAYQALAGRVLAAAGAEGVVLEAGCGEGYGMPLLRAAGARRVLGLDYDATAARHLAGTYGLPVARANLAHLPVADAAVAAVVCLQVIEHLWTPWEFLAETARVLRPGGLLVVTTPNRLTFSPGLGRGEKPPNPFHVKEFDADELVGTIAPHLTVEEVLGVRHGPRLPPGLIDEQLAGPAREWSAGLAKAVRGVTVADFALTPLSPQVLDLVAVARKGTA